MRCRECNVDLSENYDFCPLCSGKATDDEAKIKNIKDAPYPENAAVPMEIKVRKPATAFTFEKLKAYFNL